MSSFPKSVESEVTRFFYTRQRDNKGKKNGGMVGRAPGCVDTT